ncbi:MAG: TIR domain-containing protein [Egibacteraceae bacterium]
MYRPRIFIGSSTEGLEVGKALEGLLEREAEAILWTRGVFRAGHGALEALESIKDSLDAAVLILTPDDVIESRNLTIMGPRDNVVFELGFFTGQLGRRRCFLLYNRDLSLKIPSDLEGVTPLTYGSRSDSNLRAALGPACTELMNRCRELGPFDGLLLGRNGSFLRRGARERPIIYWAARHRNTAKNSAIKEYLNFMHGWDEHHVTPSLDDIVTLVADKSVHVCGSFRNETAMQKLRESRLGSVVRELVLPKDVIDLQAARPSDYPWQAREEAIRIQEVADMALAILPRYGMDTSWQIGYAVGRGQQIIGWLSNDYGFRIERALIWDHWMHGWRLVIL